MPGQVSTACFCVCTVQLKEAGGRDARQFVVVFFNLLFVTFWEIIVTLKFKGHQRAEMMWDVGVGRGGVTLNLFLRTIRLNYKVRPDC